MNIQINITNDQYPILFNIKPDEIPTIANKIFKLGYDILFPSFEKIEDIKTHSIVNEKVLNLEASLDKLIGISNTYSLSSKKGEIGENFLEIIFENRYGDIIYKNMAQTNHSGDAWLYLPDNKIIMLESKNYTYTVDKNEVTKMQNDMITHNINYGIFISLNSNIQGYKEIDIFTFQHNGNVYTILMISTLINDIKKLDLGLSIIRNILLYSNKKLHWIEKDIKNELHDLHQIIQFNYTIRDNFYITEKEIIKSLNNHFIKLRDYQYDIENKIKDILTKINNTLENSIEFTYDYDVLLNECKDPKMKALVIQIIDLLSSQKISINSQLELYNNNDKIGIIKCKLKKITLELYNGDVNFNFQLGNEKQNKQNITILEKLFI
jgi:hypothetical protein